MNKKEQALLDLAIEKDEYRRYFMKAKREYFLTMSKHHRALMQSLCDEYMQRGEYPLEMWLLSSCYHTTEDKEVAVMMTLLLRDGFEYYERASEIRALFGPSPWAWFRDRMFLLLSVGSKADAYTGGVRNIKIARLYDTLWSLCFDEKKDLTRHIGDMVSTYAVVHKMSISDALLTILPPNVAMPERIALILGILSSSDSLGQGVWAIPPHELKCPLIEDLQKFIRIWIPNWKQLGTMDDCIRVWGFEGREFDFFYLFLAYKELKHNKPVECAQYEAFYKSMYERGIYHTEAYWKARFPK